jgi:uncharacterized protein
VIGVLIRFPRNILIGVVRLYQLTISPHFPSSCRYTPTCSEYAVESFRKYGIFKGMVLAVHRISRCHPWGRGGYDPPAWYGDTDEAEAEEDST